MVSHPKSRILLYHYQLRAMAWRLSVTQWLCIQCHLTALEDLPKAWRTICIDFSSFPAQSAQAEGTWCLENQLELQDLRRPGEEWGHLRHVFFSPCKAPLLFYPEGGEDGRGAAVLNLQPAEALNWGDAEVPQEYGKTEKMPQWLRLINGNGVQHI